MSTKHILFLSGVFKHNKLFWSKFYIYFAWASGTPSS